MKNRFLLALLSSFLFLTACGDGIEGVNEMKSKSEDNLITEEEAKELVLAEVEELAQPNQMPVITSLKDEGDSFIVQWKIENTCETGTHRVKKRNGAIEHVVSNIC